LKLAEMALQGSPATPTTPLSIVLENYFVDRSDQLASAKMARYAGRLFLKNWGLRVRATDLTEERQKDLALDMAKAGMSLGHIARTMVVLAAAISHARLPIKIFASEAYMRDIWKIPAKAPRKVFVPSDEDAARIWREDMPENLRRWLLISMTTACRPEAAIDLSPQSRIRDAQAVDLNPPSRTQNKKHRPIVRAPRALTVAMDWWERAGLDMHDGRFCGYASVDSADTALWRVAQRKTVNLPRISAYSWRHKLTTVMRAAGVPDDQISRQLGHKRPSQRTTDRYGEFSPDFQREATAAIEAWIRKIIKRSKSKEIALKSHKHAIARRAAA
jgi:integrase